MWQFQNFWQKLPKTYVLEIVSEIDKTSNMLMKRHLSINESIQWSFKDVLDIFSTTGQYLIKERASWSLVKTSTTKPPGQFWTSLSDEDEKCVKQMLGSQKLQNCTSTLKKLELLGDSMKDPKFANIIKKLYNPAQFQDPRILGNGKTWMTPFCWNGNDLHLMLRSWNRLSNFDFGNSTNFYGYKFCENVQQVVSDVGPCTTFNYGSIENLLISKNRKAGLKKESLLFPVNKSKEVFDSGILLVLDTFSFAWQKNRILDNEIYLDPNNKDNRFSSPYMNDLRILFHNDKEVPMFYDREVQPILLKYDEPSGGYGGEFSSVQAHKILVSAKIQKTSKILEENALEKRNCKLVSENEGLRWFTEYSEKNCLFECKSRLARNACGCLPMWMMDYLPSKDLQETSTCNIEVRDIQHTSFHCNSQK